MGPRDARDPLNFENQGPGRARTRKTKKKCRGHFFIISKKQCDSSQTWWEYNDSTCMLKKIITDDKTFKKS